MSDAEFARVSGIGQRALVHKYRHGRRIPSPENAERISIATDGQVTTNDFVADMLATKRALGTVPEPQDAAA